jgi:hypothetical protein
MESLYQSERAHSKKIKRERYTLSGSWPKQSALEGIESHSASASTSHPNRPNPAEAFFLQKMN